MKKCETLQVHDLSVAFSESMPKYPASWFPSFRMHEIRPEDMPEAAWKRRFTTFELFTHNGTHVESSDHVTRDGRTIDQLPLASFVGFPVVFDFNHLPDGSPVDARAVEAKLAGRSIPPASIMLLKTGYTDRAWGRDDYWRAAPYLTPDAASLLASLKPTLVGLDFQTEKPGEREFPVHRELLRKGTALCEYLRNLDVIGPRTLFMAMPIHVAGAEASCVRAVAIDGLAGLAGNDASTLIL